jgi:amino acid permease
MSFKRLLFFLLIGFLVFFLVQAPGEAARLVKVTGENAGEWFESAANAFTKFLTSLA